MRDVETAPVPPYGGMAFLPSFCSLDRLQTGRSLYSEADCTTVARHGSAQLGLVIKPLRDRKYVTGL